MQNKQDFYIYYLKMKCINCNKVFDNLIHLLTHFNKCKVYCYKCNKKFTKPLNLYKHNYRVHSVSHYKCTICKKDYSNRNKYRDHIRKVHK